MKYQVLFCILSCVCLFGIMGCTSQTKGDTKPAQPEAEKAETPTDIPQPGGHLYVRLDESSQEYMADDGTHLLTITKIFPVVTISGNEEAASAINDYVRGDGLFDENSLFGLSNEEAFEWAKSDYETREHWVATYELCTGCSLQRIDDEAISFRIFAYSYM